VESALRCTCLSEHKLWKAINASAERGLNVVGIGRTRPMEDKVGHRLLESEGPWVANANSQAPEIHRADSARDVSHTIVSTMSAALFESNLTRQEVKFIVNNQHLGWVDLIELQQRLHGRTRAIHEGAGL
jgi:hypothetical protein